MKKLNILILLILFISGCKTGDTDKLVTIGNRYSLLIPSFLVEASTTLNEDASLQYCHTWKEFYVVVIDESKSDVQNILSNNNLTDKYSNDVKGYSDLLMEVFLQSVTISRKSELLDTVVNNMPARLITINGRSEGVDAFYSLAFIQGKERYYQVMAWTIVSKENEYKEKMNKIMYSLKEL